MNILLNGELCIIYRRLLNFSKVTFIFIDFLLLHRLLLDILLLDLNRIFPRFVFSYFDFSSFVIHFIRNFIVFRVRNHWLSLYRFRLSIFLIVFNVSNSSLGNHINLLLLLLLQTLLVQILSYLIPSLYLSNYLIHRKSLIISHLKHKFNTLTKVSLLIIFRIQNNKLIVKKFLIHIPIILIKLIQSSLNSHF